MGLTAAVARRASRGAHVLIVEVPGWGETRMLLEAELDRRGWKVALSPADADVLAVCGIPGDEFQAICDRLWNQLPGPRTLVNVVTTTAVSSSLDTAAAHLLDESSQRQDARARSVHAAAEDAKPDAGEHVDHGGMDHEGMDMSEGMNHEGMNHEGMDHEDMDMSEGMDHGGMNHEGMDHGGMEMPMPGGIPLAEGGEDRDGLEMDVLNVPLGPVLPHWPAGLVVDCVLQGDVIVSADARILTAGARREEPAIHSAVADGRLERVIRLCDLTAQLLALAGWPAAAQNARKLRDDALRKGDHAGHAAALDRLRRRVERSFLLRWSLKGIRVADPSGEDTDGAEAGDIRLRLIGWLRDASELAELRQAVQESNARDDADRAQRLLAALPDLLRGADLGTARLLVAGVGLDTAAVEQTHEQAHGRPAHDGVAHD